MVSAVLSELKPRDREVVELNLRHDLYDTDLATALGVSRSRAHALASHAQGRLEDALSVLFIAQTGREACSELNALLADWDGRLTEQTRAHISRHIEKCMTCATRKSRVLEPAAISGLSAAGRASPRAAGANPTAVLFRTLPYGHSPATRGPAYGIDMVDAALASTQAADTAA